jgi:hypothetical protein
MLPVAFLVTSAKGNERQALLKMLEKNVTYIADRGYVSVKIYHQLVLAEAYFISHYISLTYLCIVDVLYLLSDY